MIAVLQYLILSIRNPKTLFTTLSEKSGLKGAVGIILLLGILHGILDITFDQKFAATFHLKDRPIVLVMLYPFFMGLLLFIGMGLGSILETLWIQLCFKLMRVQAKFVTVLTVMIYASVPLFLRDIVTMLWSGILVKSGTPKIAYYKTSLAQFTASYKESSPRIFHFLSQIELFGIWSFVLGVLAISIIGKISYKKSFLIIFLFWLASSFLYALFMR